MKRILMTGCLAAACSFAAAAAAPADELEGLLGRLCRAEAMAGGAVKNDSVASVCADLSGYYNYISADSSRLYAERGLALLPDTPSELHATLLNNCANAFFSAGDMPRAKEWLFRTLREAEALGVGSLRIDALSALGVVYRRCEMPDSAFVCYSRAAELAEASGEESSVANLYINIAVLYANTRRLDEALVYARKGLERSLRSDETGQQLYAYQTLGSIQVLLERREEAAATLRDAYALAVRADMPTFVVKCAAPLISNFTLLGRPDSVRRYISLTEPYLGRVAPGSVEGLGYKEVIAQFYLNTGRYGESLRLYRELLAEEGNLATPRPLLLNRIARAEAGLGRYAEAYRTMAECYAVQDSVSGARFQEQLSDFSARYDAQQKELEIATLREERALQRVSTMRYVVWSVVLIVLLAAAVSLLLFLRRRQIARGRAREREFEAFRRQTDLRLARKYIDGLEAERTRLARELHDGICSDLLGLEMRMRHADPTPGAQREAVELLTSMRESVRNISHELMPPALQYATLDEMIGDYTSHLELPPAVDLRYRSSSPDGWGDIPPKVSYELYRILQEVMSNLVRHSGATLIDVELRREARRIVCTVRDDGRAPDRRQQRTQGIGLRTVADRLRTIGGGMRLERTDTGTTLTLEIAL